MILCLSDMLMVARLEKGGGLMNADPFFLCLVYSAVKPSRRISTQPGDRKGRIADFAGHPGDARPQTHSAPPDGRAQSLRVRLCDLDSHSGRTCTYQAIFRKNLTATCHASSGERG